LECLIRKDDGGLRILVRDVKKLDDFIRDTKAADKYFEDIKKQPARRKWNNENNINNNGPTVSVKIPEAPIKNAKNALEKITIFLEGRDTIFNLKAFLASNQAPFSTSAKTTKVFLKAGDKIVEIGGNYCLDENDLARMKKINGISVLD
jgi:hypothetical protein